MTVGELADHLAELRRSYEQADRGLQVIEVAGGYRLVTKPQYAAFVEKLRRPQRIRLSRAALETLAIIAYRQPVTAGEIEQIRGVNSSGVLHTLVERELVSASGRREGPGRPRLYVTTQKFLDVFGIASLDELPPLAEAETEAQIASLFSDRGLAPADESGDAAPESAGMETEDASAAEVTTEPSVSVPDASSSSAPVQEEEEE